MFRVERCALHNVIEMKKNQNVDYNWSIDVTKNKRKNDQLFTVFEVVDFSTEQIQRA